MAARSSVRLFDIEPDLVRFLSVEDRSEAAELCLPTARLARGTVALDDLLSRTNAFGAIVLDGVLLQSIQVADQVGLRLLGPGDVIGVGDGSGSGLRAGSATTTERAATLALLGNEILVAAHRWPRLVVGLLSRVATQTDRVADQLVICQFPRVEDRIRAIMWQLAEVWGYVTPAGTVLPLTLTHENLGGLVGARRSTVTLALGRLAEQGAIIRNGEEWLLLEEPPRATRSAGAFAAPIRLEWRQPVNRENESNVEREREMLRAVFTRLREEHLRARGEVRERLERLRTARVRTREIRGRVAAQQSVRRRRAPS